MSIFSLTFLCLVAAVVEANVSSPPLYHSSFETTASSIAPNCSYGHESRPNIVFILTDDQDYRLGSTKFQPVLEELIAKRGVTFTNHFTTIAQCCPARASIWRGQAAHNTNITAVDAPGGDYHKWVLSGENKDSLPHWLKKAGYRTEYIGKYLNGYDTYNYNLEKGGPSGWDYTNILMDPYTHAFNNVVMSKNGERPLSYHGYHQTDVLVANILHRLESMAESGQSFFIEIAPGSPHADTSIGYPVPPVRYVNDFAEVRAPRLPNFNPPDDIQKGQVSWVRDLPFLNDTEIEWIDFDFRRRLQSLKGIDDLVEGVISKLEDLNILENTYVVYTSDNGWHSGNHRIGGGKAMLYVEDVNLPFFVRGPGIPKGAESNLPSAHVDLATTFLNIAGLSRDSFPTFLDGFNLLPQWQDPNMAFDGEDQENGREIMNVEFWGVNIIETPWNPPYGTLANTSYKSLRIVSESHSYLYNRWCTGQTEFYDTKADPYELHNLVNTTDLDQMRLMDRLNAILLVTKSCAENTCRDPFSVIQPPNASDYIDTLQKIMNPKFDNHFASFPKVAFKECLLYQYAPNEHPFWPESAESLASEHREPTDNYATYRDNTRLVPPSDELMGSEEQKGVSWDAVVANARNLTDEELHLKKQEPLTTYGAVMPTQGGWPNCIMVGCDNDPATGVILKRPGTLSPPLRSDLTSGYYSATYIANNPKTTSTQG